MVSRRPLTPLLWQFGGSAEAGGVTYVLAPFAGGSAYSFAAVPSRLVRPGDTTLVIQYPGRGPRIGEPHAAGLAELAREAAHDIARHTTGTLVLAGHSMGGVLCYETAALLTAAGRAPAWVVVSAARPPGRFRFDHARVLSMGRVEWLTEIADGAGAAGSPAEAEEIADLLIPVMRADYLMLAGYRPEHRPLTVPLLAIGGADDPSVTVEHLADWQAWTAGGFERRVVPGGHFYYREQVESFCDAIRSGPRPGGGSQRGHADRNRQESPDKRGNH